MFQCCLMQKLMEKVMVSFLQDSIELLREVKFVILVDQTLKGAYGDL